MFSYCLCYCTLDLVINILACERSKRPPSHPGWCSEWQSTGSDGSEGPFLLWAHPTHVQGSVTEVNLRHDHGIVQGKKKTYQEHQRRTSNHCYSSGQLPFVAPAVGTSTVSCIFRQTQLLNAPLCHLHKTYIINGTGVLEFLSLKSVHLN